MKFYINPEGVICWNPKGWPELPLRSNFLTQKLFDESEDGYEKALSSAKADSVPVREGKSVREVICRHNGHFDNKEFYEVPDSEINKEWL